MLFNFRSLRHLFISSLYLLLAIIFLISVCCLHETPKLRHKGWTKRDIQGVNIHYDRLDNLKKVCDELGETQHISSLRNKDVFDHILVDSKHEILYCYVPKVASTNWKRIFMILTGKSNTSDVISIPANEAHSRNAYLTLRNYSSHHAQYLLNKYTKFLFVRHPFERLLSAYKNKLEQNYLSSNYFKDRIGKYIIQNFRNNLNNVSENAGNDVSFEEFTTFLVKSVSSDFNEHWKPVHKLCEPCVIKYDFVGKYETLWSDSNFILQIIGVSNVRFPQSPKKSSTTKQLGRYFSNLSVSRINELYGIYKLDFKMFSYSLVDFFGYEIG